MKSIYVITTPAIRNTDRVSFKFMFDSKAPFEKFASISGNYGIVKLTDKDSNEINPFKLARGESGAIGSDGVKKWRINIFDSDGLVLAGSVEESPQESGLQKILGDVDSCVLLMETSIVDKFRDVCNVLGIQIDMFACDEILSTS